MRTFDHHASDHEVRLCDGEPALTEIADLVDDQDVADRDVIPAGDDRLSDFILDPDLLPAGATAHLGSMPLRFHDSPEEGPEEGGDND